VLDAFKYRGDIIGLWGDVDTLTSAAGPGIDRRTVTGATNEDLSAWAFDGTLTFDTALPLQPVLVAGYAFGSGDGAPGNGTDHNFRQSDLHGGNSRYGLERAAHKNYGEVLRPELSNLHIITAGADFPVTPAADIGVTYFNYHLAEQASGMRSAGITAALTGADEDIGQAVDVVLNVDVDEQFGAKPALVDDIGFRFIVGSFFPGDAYGVNEGEDAYRVFTEMKLRF
jgi:alginate production protein